MQKIAQQPQVTRTTPHPSPLTIVPDPPPNRGLFLASTTRLHALRTIYAGLARYAHDVGAEIEDEIARRTGATA